MGDSLEALAAFNGEERERVRERERERKRERERVRVRVRVRQRQRDRETERQREREFLALVKGDSSPKIKILSSFTFPQVIPNLQEFLLSTKELLPTLSIKAQTV